MHKTLMLTLVIVSAAWSQAQSGYPQSDGGQTPGKTSSLTTIEGCLWSSSGHFILADSHGIAHQLSGEYTGLIHYVGQEVEITGQVGVKSTATAIQGTESTTREVPVFRVRSVKHIADTCKSAGN